MGSDETVISVRNLGKKYRLYDRPQDRLKQQLLQRFGKCYGRDFWALHGATFDVKRGETFGLIGRNGSGKSTLLQLLAGVLRPTEGEVSVCGRVAALLELGSGFNPNYTGRENVFMNGAILGIPRAEMEERFADIAAFADIGRFLDQPVKTYSSGMFVRLAFAITVNVDADVLLIDEALAVGDVFFRQKCYQHLESMLERGVTIILVSHTMPDVEQFCRRALLLRHGEVVFQGAASEAVKHYYLVNQDTHVTASSTPTQTSETLMAPVSTETPWGWPASEALMNIASVAQVTNGAARCTGIAVCNHQGQPCQLFQQGETASFFYEFEILRDIEVPIGGLVIQNDKGFIIHGKNTLEYDSEVPMQLPRGARLRFRQDINLEIAVGEYTFEIGLAAISREDYAYRSLYSHTDLHAKIIRLCHLSAVGQFAVTFRRQAMPVHLMHHGLANLPGQCQVTAVIEG
jgi:ABC-type polysaccharide/polyol phosphate transport system ATPase subunit